MSLETIIHEGLTRPGARSRALVLMGGGARTAYQVGVLGALASLLRLQPGAAASFPFQILVGTSAGALNVAYLASAARTGLAAFDELRRFWGELHCDAVYRLDAPPWVRFSRLLAAVKLWGQARRRGAVLDTMPLVDTLIATSRWRRSTSRCWAARSSRWRSRPRATRRACNGPSATPPVHRIPSWSRPGRRSEFQPLTIEHLMASAPCPSCSRHALWVDGRREYFGDGSMRQISPLSPAVHLGARQCWWSASASRQRAGSAAPAGAASGAGRHRRMRWHVFHDTLQADVEQTQRLAATLRQLPREVAAVLPYRAIDVLAIQPTESLDALAHEHAGRLPRPVRHALAGLGAGRDGGEGLASYLLFEPEFVQALVALGERDAYERKDELLAFLGAGAA